MKKGKNLILVPGGFEEASLSKNGSLVMVLRKGFIKYGLQYGYSLHPSLVFGEENMFTVVEGFKNFKLFLNKLKLPAVLFYSKYLLFPNNDIDIEVHIGSKIQLPLIENPSEEDIEIYH